MSVASVHKVVVAKLKWRLKNNNNTKSRKSKDLRHVRDPYYARNISGHVTSQFSSTGDHKQDYSLFSWLARDSVGKDVPDKVRVSSRKPLEDSNIVEARRALMQAKLISIRTELTRIDLNRRNVQRSCQISMF